MAVGSAGSDYLRELPSSVHVLAHLSCGSVTAVYAYLGPKEVIRLMLVDKMCNNLVCREITPLLTKEILNVVERARITTSYNALDDYLQQYEYDSEQGFVLRHMISIISQQNYMDDRLMDRFLNQNSLLLGRAMRLSGDGLGEILTNLCTKAVIWRIFLAKNADQISAETLISAACATFNAVSERGYPMLLNERKQPERIKNSLLNMNTILDHISTSQLARAGLRSLFEKPEFAIVVFGNICRRYILLTITLLGLYFKPYHTALALLTILAGLAATIHGFGCRCCAPKSFLERGAAANAVRMVVAAILPDTNLTR